MKKTSFLLGLISSLIFIVAGFIFIFGCGTNPTGGGGGDGGKGFYSEVGLARASGANNGTIHVGVFDIPNQAMVPGITIEAGGSVETTGVDGKCTLTGMPSGKIFVTAFVRSDTTLSVYVSASDITFYFPGSSTPPSSTGTLIAKVKNGNGVSVEGVDVWASPKGQHWATADQTDSDGCAELDEIPAGDVRITVPSIEGGSYEVVTVPANGTAEVNLILDGSATISGNITSFAGFPVDWARVDILYSLDYASGQIGDAVISPPADNVYSYAAKVPATRSDFRYWVILQALNTSDNRKSLFILDYRPISVSSGGTVSRNYSFKEVPANGYPSDGEPAVSSTPSFEWASSWTPTNYYVKIDNIDNEDAPMLYVMLEGTDNTVQIPSNLALDGLNEYQWTICAVDAPGFDPAAFANFSFPSSPIISAISKASFETEAL